MLKSDRSEATKKEFSEKILEHMDSLYNLAYRLTYNKEEASDLVQEASMRAYRFYHKFEQGTNFKAWIMTILRNIFINNYRKKVKEPSIINYDGYDNGLDHMFSIDKLTGAEEEIFGESVQNAINKLPEELQTTVILFYVEELAYKEIASVMKCPMGTVMSRLHMARKILKSQLANASKRGELK